MLEVATSVGFSVEVFEVEGTGLSSELPFPLLYHFQKISLLVDSSGALPLNTDKLTFPMRNSLEALGPVQGTSSNCCPSISIHILLSMKYIIILFLQLQKGRFRFT